MLHGYGDTNDHIILQNGIQMTSQMSDNIEIVKRHNFILWVICYCKLKIMDNVISEILSLQKCPERNIKQMIKKMKISTITLGDMQISCISPNDTITIKKHK